MLMILSITWIQINTTVINSPSMRWMTVETEFQRLKWCTATRDKGILHRRPGRSVLVPRKQAFRFAYFGFDFVSLVAKGRPADFARMYICCIGLYDLNDRCGERGAPSPSSFS